MDIKDFIYSIPKAELHLHLEGTLEPELKLELAQKNGIDIGLKTVQEVKDTYQFNDLPSFLDVYYKGMSVLITEDDFYQLADQYLQKAQKQNVKYCELFFDPQAHTSRGVSFETFFNGYYRAISEASKYGIEAKLIMCFLRDLSEESALEHYEMARPYFDKILGIGLDSDEKDNPPLKFKNVFKKAKEDGFHITMHCDIDQIDSIQHIRDCLYEIKVERIDHGTNIIEDESCVEYAIANHIGFTTCPVSNSFVRDDCKAKEIKYLLDKGALVTVNSDDPAYFQSYIADDLYMIATKLQLSKEDIVKLVKNAFELAWLSPKQKQHYFDLVDQFVNNH